MKVTFCVCSIDDVSSGFKVVINGHLSCSDDRLMARDEAGEQRQLWVVSFQLRPSLSPRRYFYSRSLKCRAELVSQTCPTRSVLAVGSVLAAAHSPFSQRHRIIAKRGAHFTIMVVGQYSVHVNAWDPLLTPVHCCRRVWAGQDHPHQHALCYRTVSFKELQQASC